MMLADQDNAALDRYVEQMARLGDWITQILTPQVETFLTRVGMLQHARRRAALRRVRLSTQVRRHGGNAQP